MSSEQEVVQEGVLVLLGHLGVSKTAQFLAHGGMAQGMTSHCATPYSSAKL